MGIVLILFIGIPTSRSVYESLVIRWKLFRAKSVQLVHFNPYSGLNGPEIVYRTKDLKPEDFSKVAAAFPIRPDIGLPFDGYNCIFDPHHRIVITDAAGKQTVIRVCFLCDHTEVGDWSNNFITPYLWRYSLRRFFDDEGLPFTPDRYMQDYQKNTR